MLESRGTGEWKTSQFSVFSCQWRRGRAGIKSRKKRAYGGGAGVKLIKTKRLAKGSPPGRSDRAGSSATLSAETAGKVGHPGASERIEARTPARQLTFQI